MAELPNPPDPDKSAPPAEAFRRQALEATLAEALRDSRLSAGPDARQSLDARQSPDAHQSPDARPSVAPPVKPGGPARPAPSMIGSKLGAASAPPASGEQGGSRSLGVNRLVPPTGIGGDSRIASDGPSTIGLGGSLNQSGGPSGYSLGGSNTLEPDEVNAVIELRRPSSTAPRGDHSGSGASASPGAAPAQKSTTASSRDEVARRAAAIGAIPPWSPEADDILPGLASKRGAKSQKPTKSRNAPRNQKTPKALRSSGIIPSAKSKRR